MNKDEALRQLEGCINDDGGLSNLGHYIAWDPKYPERIVLDSEFDADQLEAIIWWMRNMKPTLKLPYDWCHGSPTKEDCARRGYCDRDPNCGE